MAINTQLSTVAVEAEAGALATLLNNGYIKIYSGTQPANADTAPTGSEVVLAELRFPSIAFASVSNGVLISNTISPAVAVADGTATWFRTFTSNGQTAVIDGSVGTSDANLVIGSVSITQGLIVNVTSFIHTLNKFYAGT